MALSVRGRIISVRPRPNGQFGVTLGPPPKLFHFVVDEQRGRPCPKLGQKVHLRGQIREQKIVGSGTAPARLAFVEQASWEIVDEPYPVRVVNQAWVDRVQAMMLRPLFRYQADGAAWMAARLAGNKGSILGDDPGLGKTGQTVAALCAVGAFPALIVCPASLKEQWAREFMWALSSPSVDVVEGRRGGMPGADVVIMNYQLLRWREQQMAELRPRVLVFDEAHALKEPRPSPTHRAAVATRMVQRFGPAILLTGSPVLNRTQELWRLLHLVDHREWPDYDSFRWRYCGVRRKAGRASREERERRKRVTSVETKAGRVERVNELSARVQPVMLRRLKHQVLADLPPKQRRKVAVRIGARELAHYRAAEKDVVAWLKLVGQGLRASRAIRAKAIVRLTMLRRIAALAKLQRAIPSYLASWFDRTAPEPLVIFGYHRDVMLGLYSICTKLGLRTVGIGGREAVSKRQAAVDAFMSGYADVFLAPIMAAGFGLNLQRASEAVFVERVWSLATLEQAEDRIHRLGQLRPVTITYIDAVGTVDEHMQAVLSAKQKLVQAAVDGKVGPDDGLVVTEVATRLLERR